MCGCGSNDRSGGWALCSALRPVAVGVASLSKIRSLLPVTICEEAQALNALYCSSSKFIMLMYGPGPTRPPVSAGSALLCSPVAGQRTDCMCVTVDLMCDIITGAFDNVSGSLGDTVDQMHAIITGAFLRLHADVSCM